MPGISGIDLARELLRIRPDIPILMTSGCSRTQDREAMRNLDLPDLILKPNAVEDLGNLIHDLLTQEHKRKIDRQQVKRVAQAGPNAKTASSHGG